MDWLGQNWLWIALAIGAFFLMTQMGGCGMGRARGRHDYDEDRHDIAPPAVGNRPSELFDAVSGHRFPAGASPISTVYHGRAYYFENRENRETFETDPEKYLTENHVVGESVGEDSGYERRPHRHRGC